MQRQSSAPEGMSSFSRRWHYEMSPYQRGLAVFVVLSVLLIGGLMVTGQGAGPAILLGALAAGMVAYFLGRRGTFAQQVRLRLVGKDGDETVTRKLRTVMRQDRIQTIDDPEFVSAEEAGEIIEPLTRVIGVEHNGIAKAYPLRVLSLREAVNDEFDGEPVLVTWSPFCYADRVYVAENPRGEHITFGSSGILLLNSPVFYERGTGGLWVQFDGQAITGPDEGEFLEPLPSIVTTWQAWSETHPGTLLLTDERAPDRDLFDNYYSGGRAGVHGLPIRDMRWNQKEVVAGVEADDEPVAFPISWLVDVEVVNESVGSDPVLVVFEKSSGAVTAYSREVGGRTLTFSAEGGQPDPRTAEEDEPLPEYTPLMLRDEETGSRWHALKGECVEGELQGERLERETAGLSFWFAWSNFHPLGRLMQTPEWLQEADTEKEPA